MNDEVKNVRWNTQKKYDLFGNFICIYISKSKAHKENYPIGFAFVNKNYRYAANLKP